MMNTAISTASTTVSTTIMMTAPMPSGVIHLNSHTIGTLTASSITTTFGTSASTIYSDFHMMTASASSSDSLSLPMTVPVCYTNNDDIRFMLFELYWRRFLTANDGPRPLYSFNDHFDDDFNNSSETLWCSVHWYYRQPDRCFINEDIRVSMIYTVNDFHMKTASSSSISTPSMTTSTMP